MNQWLLGLLTLGGLVLAALVGDSLRSLVEELRFLNRGFVEFHNNVAGIRQELSIISTIMQERGKQHRPLSSLREFDAKMEKSSAKRASQLSDVA